MTQYPARGAKPLATDADVWYNPMTNPTLFGFAIVARRFEKEGMLSDALSDILTSPMMTPAPLGGSQIMPMNTNPRKIEPKNSRSLSPNIFIMGPEKIACAKAMEIPNAENPMPFHRADCVVSLNHAS